MAFSSVGDFLAMGGYGFYVWLAYSVSFLALIFLVLSTINRRNKIVKTVKQRALRQQRIKNAQNMEGTL